MENAMLGESVMSTSQRGEEGQNVYRMTFVFYPSLMTKVLAGDVAHTGTVGPG